jgi:hypothetical protein
MDIKSIRDDLVTTNELGDGSREYYIDSQDRLCVDLYEDPNDGQKLTGSFVINITFEKN